MKTLRLHNKCKCRYFLLLWKHCFKPASSPCLHSDVLVKKKKKKRNTLNFCQSVIVFRGTQLCSDNVRFVLCHGWFCVKSTSNEHLNCLFSCWNLHHCMTPFQPQPCFYFFSPLSVWFLRFNRHESGCERCIKYIMGCRLPHQLDSLLTFDGLYSYETSNDYFLC